MSILSIKKPHLTGRMDNLKTGQGKNIKRTRFSKRKRFLISALILSAGLIVIQTLPDSFKYLGIIILSLLTCLMFIISLWEGLGPDFTLLTLILPVFFTLSVGMFWFLLPSSLLLRIPIVFLFAVGVYSLSLTTNIYTVSAVRSIALLRAARGVGFVITLFTMFLLFDSFISMRISIFYLVPLIIICSFLLFLQGYWPVLLEKKASKKLYVFSLISALIVGEIAIVMYFWPVSVAVGSLMLILVSYVLLGLGQSDLEGRLFDRTTREYLSIFILISIFIFFITSWSG